MPDVGGVGILCKEFYPVRDYKEERNIPLEKKEEKNYLKRRQEVLVTPLAPAELVLDFWAFSRWYEFQTKYDPDRQPRLSGSPLPKH